MTGDPRNLLKCAEIVLYALRLFTAVVADAFYRSDLEGLNELMQTHLPVVRRALMHILSLVAALSTAEEEKFAPVLALLQHVVLDFSALEEAVVHAVSTAPGGAEASPESEPKYEPKPYQKVVVVKGRRSAVPLKTKNKSASWLMRTGGAALALLAVLWVFRKRRPSFVDALGLHLRNRFDRGREFGAAAAAALRVITDPPPPYSPPRSPFIMPTGHPISAAWGSPSPYFAAGDTPRVMPSAPPPP
ncbi:hypothetical protein BESB_082550 [Besnoitia besnoiti]|uniref:Transmembrane protein n=1 Tax=Besnoitia besnoiti TaxID=94643 RepID=A0A2A9MAU6_BESBE|nr:hypothetical protein BESB_082550 [Besnoitia besnoiti]PFH33056.1 hypothetical protein BESB_082550 [Besnoitia besnoiti]